MLIIYSDCICILFICIVYVRYLVVYIHYIFTISFSIYPYFRLTLALIQNFELLEEALDEGVDIETIDVYGNTLLMLSAQQGRCNHTNATLWYIMLHRLHMLCMRHFIYIYHIICIIYYMYHIICIILYMYATLYIYIRIVLYVFLYWCNILIFFYLLYFIFIILFISLSFHIALLNWP